jgi:hypothetical protein
VPTAGRYQRVNFEWSAAGDVRYLRTNLQYQQYWQLPAKMSLGINAELGIGKGLGGKPYPIFKNFYGGGLGSVRVFEQGSLGVIDPTGAFIGGSRKFNLNAELYLPGARLRQRQVVAHLRLRRCRQRLARGREDRPPPAAGLGRAGPELDLAGRPAQAQLGHAAAGAAQR